MADLTRMDDFNPVGGLTNPIEYPATPISETAARAQIQHPLDELKDALNGLMEELEDTETGHSGAERIGCRPINGEVDDTVWAQMNFLNSKILAAWEGVLGDGDVTNAKLASDVKVGSLASLTTTAKASVVGAVNELDSDIGDMSTATTTASTVVGAINELDAKKVVDGDIDGQAVGETNIKANAVTTTKIANRAVTMAKIADHAVGSLQMVPQSVGPVEIIAHSVGEAQLNLACDRNRKITISASDPSGGDEGDVWIKY